MGVPAYFLRLKSCNLLCGGKGTDKDKQLHNGATWRCDTIEVWLKGVQKTFEQIVDDFGGAEFVDNLYNRTHHLVITGGEPMLYDRQIDQFINYIYRRCGGRHGVPIIEIETNGTFEPGSLLGKVDYWNVSPKLANSGMPKDKRIKMPALRAFAKGQDTIFKFVISNADDFKEAYDIALQSGIDKKQIWLMPAADSRTSLVKASQFVAAICAKHGFKMSSRLHLQIWDKKTGV